MQMVLPCVLLGGISRDVHWQHLLSAVLQEDAQQETDAAGHREHRRWGLQFPEMDPVSLDYSFIHSFVHSFIQAISIAPLQVHCQSEARRSATGNCEWRTCPRSRNPSDERRQIYQWATMPYHYSCSKYLCCSL